MVSDTEAFSDSPFPDVIEIHVFHPLQNRLVPSPMFSRLYSVAHQTATGTRTNSGLCAPHIQSHTPATYRLLAVI